MILRDQSHFSRYFEAKLGISGHITQNLAEQQIGVAVFVNDAVNGYPLMMLAAEFTYKQYVNPGEKILSEYKKIIDKSAKKTARRVKKSVNRKKGAPRLIFRGMCLPGWIE